MQIENDIIHYLESSCGEYFCESATNPQDIFYITEEDCYSKINGIMVAHFSAWSNDIASGTITVSGHVMCSLEGMIYNLMRLDVYYRQLLHIRKTYLNQINLDRLEGYKRTLKGWQKAYEIFEDSSDFYGQCVNKYDECIDESRKEQLKKDAQKRQDKEDEWKESELQCMRDANSVKRISEQFKSIVGIQNILIDSLFEIVNQRVSIIPEKPAGEIAEFVRVTANDLRQELMKMRENLEGSNLNFDYVSSPQDNHPLSEEEMQFTPGSVMNDNEPMDPMIFLEKIGVLNSGARDVVDVALMFIKTGLKAGTKISLNKYEEYKEWVDETDKKLKESLEEYDKILTNLRSKIMDVSREISIVMGDLKWYDGKFSSYTCGIYTITPCIINRYRKIVKFYRDNLRTILQGEYDTTGLSPAQCNGLSRIRAKSVRCSVGTTSPLELNYPKGDIFTKIKYTKTTATADQIRDMNNKLSESVSEVINYCSNSFKEHHKVIFFWNVMIFYTIHRMIFNRAKEGENNTVVTESQEIPVRQLIINKWSLDYCRNFQELIFEGFEEQGIS